MGFFSWNTCDTDEAIMNVHTGEHKTTYMLSPDGTTFKEDAYEGYGEFGGKDAYEHLVDINDVMPDITGEEKRDVGIDIEMGTVYFVLESGEFFRSANDCTYGYGWIQKVSGGLYVPQAILSGKTMIEASADGDVIKLPMRQFLIRGEYSPLKFSFDSQCEYVNNPASENEPGQGFGF